jgi:hypothetical protein
MTETDTAGTGLDPAALAAESLAAGGVSGVAVDPAPDPEELVDQIVQLLAESAPPDFTALGAVFSMAGGEEIVEAVADTPDDLVRIAVPIEAVQWAREHRELTVGEMGPWLRLLLEADDDGTLNVGFDYGDTRIPSEHLLSPEAYLTDLERHPHANVALWLMAYIADGGHQQRSPAEAAAAEEDDDTDAPAQLADDEIPPFPELWSRLAVLAAVCAGLNMETGPRIDTAIAVHRGFRGGCTLSRLPDGRAVLSGGTDDSELLEAAYQGLVEFPDLYRGAPRWVHDIHLDERAAGGLLSFCYWWHDGHWYRADIVAVHEDWLAEDEARSGLPDISSAASTASSVLDVLEIDEIDEMNAAVEQAAGELVAAAESRVATPAHIQRLFPDEIPEEFDVDEALAQLDAAGTLLPAHRPIDAGTAKRLLIESLGDGAADEQVLDRLTATRVDAGWSVTAPAGEGEIAIESPVFLVADDGVIEQMTTQTALEFAARFAARLRSRLG